MKKAFIDELIKQAEINDKIYLLVGDMGYNVVEPFQEKFPDRFINCGIAEQNMLGVASGLAMQGKKVFVYSLANFVVIRALEQLRNDICYSNLDVKIIGIGGGLQYGSAGYSHHCVEDLAVTLALPNLTVAAPGSVSETVAVVALACNTSGPTYIRLGKADVTQDILGEDIIKIGGYKRFDPGYPKLTLVSTGGMLGVAHTVAKRLGHIEVISMPYLKPFNENPIYFSYPTVVTLEDHGYGGLAMLVANTISKYFYTRNRRFIPIRIQDNIARVAGSEDYLRDLKGLDVESVILKIKEYI